MGFIKSSSKFSFLMGLWIFSFLGGGGGGGGGGGRGCFKNPPTPPKIWLFNNNDDDYGGRNETGTVVEVVANSDVLVPCHTIDGGGNAKFLRRSLGLARFEWVRVQTQVRVVNNVCGRASLHAAADWHQCLLPRCVTYLRDRCWTASAGCSRSAVSCSSPAVAPPVTSPCPSPPRPPRRRQTPWTLAP